MDQMPNLGREKEMLEVLGLKSMDDLFTNIPDEIRRKDPLPLPPPQSEEEIWSDALNYLVPTLLWMISQAFFQQDLLEISYLQQLEC